MDKQTVRGSYTVEAALILPIILFVIIELLYLGFHLHDKVKIQSKMNEAAIKGLELIQYESDMYTGLIDFRKHKNRSFLYPYFTDFTEKEDIINSYLMNQLNTGLFITKIDSTTVSVSSSNISLMVKGHMEIPFQEVKEIFTHTGLDIENKTSVEIHKTAEFIRIFDVFSGVAEKVEYLDEIILKLQNILHAYK